jgi:DNA-binding response OmpR family regulator
MTFGMTAATGERPPTGPPIWIVDSDHWPRAYLRAELLEHGYDAAGFETLKDALLTLALPRARRPALLIIHLPGQTIDDDARTALARARIPILAVAGAGRADDQSLAPLAGTLHRPLTIGAIADAVDRLIDRAARIRG